MLAKVVNFRTDDSLTRRVVKTSDGMETVVASPPRIFMEIELMLDNAGLAKNEELLKSIGQSGMMRLSAPDSHVPEVVREVSETKPQEVVEKPDHW